MDWEFAFVLPNLVLPSDLHDTNPGAFPDGITVPPNYLKIFPGDHSLVTQLRAADKTVEQILRSFRNEYGKPYFPAVLLVARSTPQIIKQDLEAFVAFRNVVAIATVLRGRGAALLDRGALTPTWSDTFDFHPAKVGGRGHMILQSPALSSLVSSTAALRLTHSAYVKLEGRRLWMDHYLFQALGRAWRSRFTTKRRSDAFAQRAFRSIEVAYQASAVGAKNEASLHEYGTQIALWVSACEILAWADRKRADLPAVLELLGRYPGRKATMRRRFRTTYRGQVFPSNAPQRAYTYLYAARNDFLHGNRVTTNAMFTSSGEKRVPLPRVAAVVYRTALASYLNVRYPIEISERQLRTRTIEMFDHRVFEQGFAEVFGYHF